MKDTSIVIHPVFNKCNANDSDASRLFEQAQQFWRAGDLQTALKCISDSIRSNQADGNAWALRGVIHGAFGLHVAAERDFEQAISLAPNSKFPYSLRWQYYYGNGRLARAIYDLEQLTLLDPDDSHARFILAELLLETDDCDRALHSVNEALKLDSTFAAGYRTRALCHYIQCAWQEVIDDATRFFCMSGKPEYLLLNHRSEAYARLERFADALRDVEKALQIIRGTPFDTANNRAMLRLNRASCLARLGKYRSALQDYKWSVDYDPANSQAYIGAGECEHGLGNYEAAIEWLSKAIRVEPDNWQALSRRAAIYRSTGKVAEALRDYCLALQLEPDSYETHAKRASLYFELNEFAKAAADFARAAELCAPFLVPDFLKSQICALEAAGECDRAHFVKAQLSIICEELNDSMNDDEVPPELSSIDILLSEHVIAAEEKRQGFSRYIESQVGESWRWDLDLQRKCLTFSETRRNNGVVQLVGSERQFSVDLEVCATISHSEGTWLWAWANPQMKNVCGLSEIVLNYGLRFGIRELITPQLSIADSLDGSLAHIACQIANADAMFCYRADAFSASPLSYYFLIKYTPLTGTEQTSKLVRAQALIRYLLTEAKVPGLKIAIESYFNYHDIEFSYHGNCLTALHDREALDIHFTKGNAVHYTEYREVVHQ